MYRQNPLDNLTPVVKNILIIYLIFYAGAFFLRTTAHIDVDTALSVHYINSPLFRVWQIISYMFVHNGFLNLFFNMLALFIFGPTIEQSLGPKRFLQFYFLTNFGALVLLMLVQAFVVNQVIGTFTVPYGDISEYVTQPGYSRIEAIYGVSGGFAGAYGALFGLLVAFGVLYPNMELFIMFIPLPVKAKYLVIAYLLLEFYSGFAQAPEHSIGHWARIGGAITGFALIKIWYGRNTNNFY